MTKILVTGSAGFVGKHVVAMLREAGHDIVEAQRASGDITEESTWAVFPPTDVVVHLAGRSFVPDSWADPGGFIKGNLLGMLGALGYCRTHGSRLVAMSSYLYGRPTQLPITEQAPLVATNPYAFSKKLAEETCTFFTSKFAVDAIVLRPFNVYGPGQTEQFLIPAIVCQAKRGGVIRVKDLEPRRDYVYIRDLVDAIAMSINAPCASAVVNIGTGISHSVAQVIQIIQDVYGTKLVVESEGERRTDEIMDTVADITEARRVLDWQPRFSLREGIGDMFRQDQ